MRSGYSRLVQFWISPRKGIAGRFPEEWTFLAPSVWSLMHGLRSLPNLVLLSLFLNAVGKGVGRRRELSEGVGEMKLCESPGRVLSNLATEMWCQSAQNSAHGANQPNHRCTTVGSKLALPQRGALASLQITLWKTVDLGSLSLYIKAVQALG